MLKEIKLRLYLLEVHARQSKVNQHGGRNAWTAVQSHYSCSCCQRQCE